ncbi:MAG: SCO family protein [Solirubrobacterales bacterium]|nr:SCO family protein [Solirubrobacterales bacterium]
MSLRSYRGHPVIVTFIDPVCRNLCPLQAKVLDQAVREMPVSRRPAILAVSVDVYADTRADLLRDFRKWELVRQWRWAVGSRARLTAVWRSYKIAVAVSRVKVRGTTITSITHTSAAYIVDRTGHERALFLWPFYPQDVVHVLRQLPS